MSEIRDWFNQLPPLTRIWFGGSVALPLIGRLGLLSPYYMVLTSEFISRFHIWRPITAVFFYPINGMTGFHYLMNLFFLYSYSLRLETGPFTGRPADYAFLLIFNWAAITLIALFMNLPLLMDPMVLSVLYIWCSLNKETIVSFWFGTRFKAMYLPWVLLAFNMIMNGSGLVELIGIIVGHLYYFLQYQYPDQYNGPVLLKTPRILYDYLPSNTANQPGSAASSAGFQYFAPGGDRSRGQDSSSTTQRRSWGRGHVLGSS